MMEPTTDLAVVTQAAASLPQKYDNKDFLAVASAAATYLPRVMLMGSQSGLVTEQKMRAGDYAIINGEKFSDLTNTVECIPLSWRPKAMRIGDQIMSVYDTNNPEFKKIQDESSVQDSGCMFGPEFLIWIPGHGFATLFMSSKTQRREAPALNELLEQGKAATLKSHLIAPKGSKYKWWGPIVTSCSSPFAQLPDPEDVRVQVEAFQNPKETEIETADVASSSRER